MSVQDSMGPVLADALALSIIVASKTPLVMLDDDLTVIAASTSFCHQFDVGPTAAPGHKLWEVGHGEWDTSALTSLLRATLAGHAQTEPREMDLVRVGQPTRQLVLDAHKLDTAAGRLILGIADVTEAREAEKAKDDLLREKEILLQELQHRVANSLQIIASVLMLSARRVRSEETRTHLQEAHQRVLSVAAVQKQLSVSSLSAVQLGPYLTSLCDSLGASMIRDHGQLTLVVKADGSVASPKVSVSLGLIVTELVINALKHAFPDRRHGRIVVGYQSGGTGWTLSVTDDGVGMPVTATSKPGLGTSIVEALARQLDARVAIASANPGTAVSVTHA